MSSVCPHEWEEYVDWQGVRIRRCRHCDTREIVSVEETQPMLLKRNKELEQQLADTREELRIALAQRQDYRAGLTQARGLLQEALDEMKEWLWVHRERRDQTMQAMRAFLADKEQPNGN